jgi:hypothetical protein
MRTIDIDHKDCQAIRREISERLRVELGNRRVSKGRSTNSAGWKASHPQSFPMWNTGSKTSQARTQAEEKSRGSLGRGGPKADSVLAFTEANDRR